MAEGISTSFSGSVFTSVMQSSTSETATTTASTTEATSATTTSSKSSTEILSELRQDGMSGTKTAQDIADEYGVSLAKAQEILSELKNEQDGTFALDNPIPEDSTVSYHV